MNPDDIKEVKKRKPRWVGFFAVAILVASMGNILNCVYLLVVLRILYLDPITADAVKKMECNILAATGIVIAILIVYIWRLPASVKEWENKEWGKRFVFWFMLLSIVAIPATVLIIPLTKETHIHIQAYLLLEGIVLNFLVTWYFSRSKIKSTFIK